MLSTHKTARWWGLLGHGSSILGIYASVLFFALFLVVFPLRCIGEACAVIKARLGAD